jgi:hypothetical protein
MADANSMERLRRSIESPQYVMLSAMRRTSSAAAASGTARMW